MVDIPGNSTTASSVSVGSTVTGLIEAAGDHDWFRINLTAGQVIRVALNGTGTAALEDPYLRIRDASGTVLFENDDGGGGFNALVTFTAPQTGVYFIDVAAWDTEPAEYNYTGEYQLKVSNYEPPIVATVEQIAEQLTDGYWGGESHHFTVAQGGSISVNLTALTSDGQFLAREALRQWSDILGISFAEVAQNGQITFDDNEEGAHSSSVFANNVVTSSLVNISTDWLVESGTTFNSYSFQTYLHEIGHALGLGHAGNYDGDASFPFDALFLNDAWSNSVMSYFAPTENSYFAQLGFTDSSIGTPMLADILAMSQLYGLSTTTRVGNTTYGFNSNAGNIAYNAAINPTVAYTVFDSGGIDTLDYSGFTQNQTIDLTAGAFSNIGGRNGSVAIAIGTIVENAIGGSGDDTLIGNAANNLLNGGAGNDVVSYASATAGITVNLGLASAQNTSGAGTDTLLGFETLLGSQYDDRLTGGAGSTIIHGGAGNDMLIALADGDLLFGDAGNDTFIGGAGNDTLDGGDGFDTVDYSAASGTVRVGTGTAGVNGIDTLTAIERLTGSSFGDELRGAATIIGGAGNDIIGSFTVSGIGGTGDDIYDVGAGGVVTEAAGEGTDLVRSFANYILPANVENLMLMHNSDPNAGVAVALPNPVSGTGNALNNVISGNFYANQLSGLQGADTLTGGGGIDTFLDTGAGFNGDRIVDFSLGERLVFTDANPAAFTFALSGSTLTYTGGSLSFGAPLAGALTARAIAGGVGMELILAQPQFNTASLMHAGFGQAPAAGGWSSDDRFPRVLGDVNGDGHVDIIGFGELGTYVSFGNGSGTFSGHTMATTAFGAGANAGGWASNNLYTRHVADVNGDGRGDIVGFGFGGVYVALANANGSFGAMALATPAFGTTTSAGGWSTDDRFPRMLGDVNGDGRADIVGFGASGTYVALGTQSGSFAAPTLAIAAYGAGADAGGWVSNDLYSRHIADVNGDGKADIVGFGNDGVFVSLAQANGAFGTPTLSSPEFGAATGAGGWASDDRFPRELADVNGDGKIDIVGFGSAGVYVALSRGNGMFDAITADLKFFGADPNAGQWLSDDSYPRHLADLNNDGAADVVGFASAGVYVSLSNGDIFT